jgi:hypothetical protein
LIAFDLKIIHELIKKKTTQASWATAIPSKKRTLHYLWKIDKRKNRLIKIRKIPTKDVGFSISKFLGNVDRHGFLA